jgi:CheY-like chemotaxis protein
MINPSQAFYRVIASKPLYVIADATLLSRSINNILKNAIESMVDKADVLRLAVRSLPAYRAPALPFTPESSLTYGCAAKGPLARIIVHDEGEGMSQSVLDCALERFATSKKADRRRGVGLSSVKSLVDTSGGQLAIYSSPGTGTVFVLDLPAVDPASGEQFLRVTRDVVGNVILVDDDPLALARLEAFFGTEQWEVAGFGNPLEALAFLEQAPMFPQLLVTDRLMPGMDGDQLAERAKKIRPDLPVIMCSHALDGPVSVAVDASLPKPADHEVLKVILAGLDFRTGRSRP